MTIRPCHATFMLILLAALVGQTAAFAQNVPRVMQYDGRLLVDERPALGSYDVTFSLYTMLNGGPPVWSEEHEVTPDDGLFSVLLGSVNPFPAAVPAEHDTLYLSMQIDGMPEMRPRLFVAGTMYSMRAGLADAVQRGTIDTAALADAGITSAKIDDNAITEAKLADGAVTEAKLMAGAVTSEILADSVITQAKLAPNTAVTSLNSQSGTVTLVPGSNVSISEEDGTITISSVGDTGGGGTITSVLAGDGLTGGGEEGDVLLSLADAGVTDIKLADGSVTNIKIFDAAVTTEKLADQNVTNAKLASDAAVTSLNSQRGALTLAAGSNVNIEEEDGTFTISSSGTTGGGDITAVTAGAGLSGGGEAGDITLALADEGVTAEKLEDDAVTADKLADDAVTTAKLANDAVTNAKLASDAAVTSLNNRRGALTFTAGSNVEIDESNGTFTISSAIGGDGDITSVVAGSGLSGGGTVGDVTLDVTGVTNAMLVDNAVTTTKLADDAVTSAKLSNNSVVTAKLEDGAVTGPKLASNAAVTSLNGLTNAVTLAGDGTVSVGASGNTITITGAGGGDVTGVTAGAGLTGDGPTGDVTLGIATGGVESAMLASTAAVKSLNGLTDAVTLAGDGTVSVGASGNTITITGAGGGDVTGVTAGAGLTGDGPTGDVTLGIATGGVESEMLASTAAVKSLNGLTNAVTITGADGLDVSASGSTITITPPAAGGGAVTSVTAGEGLSDGGTTTGDVSLSLADDAVTSEKLADATVVRSIQGLTDVVSLTGEDGIQIDATGNTITIGYDAGGEISSKRWKTNIQTLEDPLDVVEQLRGVTFEWKEDGRSDIGLIAEEVGAVIPEIVEFEANGTDAKTVNYSRLVSVLIEAVKTQQKQLDSRDDVIEDMMARLERLEQLSQSSTSTSDAGRRAEPVR